MKLPDSIAAQRLIPLARGLEPERATNLAGALQEGGCSVLEITLESGRGFESIRAVAGSEMTVGAGTVMSIDQAILAVDAGASFLVSPHLDPALVIWCLENAVPYLPGVFTPTEVAAVLSLGATTMKVFPATVGGPGLITALRGPFPGVELVATGGITSDNAAEFISAGAMAVGVGGWLTGHSDLEVVAERARHLREVV